MATLSVRAEIGRANTTAPAEPGDAPGPQRYASGRALPGQQLSPPLLRLDSPRAETPVHASRSTGERGMDGEETYSVLRLELSLRMISTPPRLATPSTHDCVPKSRPITGLELILGAAAGGATSEGSRRNGGGWEERRGGRTLGRGVGRQLHTTSPRVRMWRTLPASRRSSVDRAGALGIVHQFLGDFLI